MPFATSNVQVASAGNLNWLIGNWSGSIGDASGTVTLKGGRVLSAHFENQDADSTEVRVVPISVSVSSGTITITVYNLSTVTLGRFIIAYQ